MGSMARINRAVRHFAPEFSVLDPSQRAARQGDVERGRGCSGMSGGRSRKLVIVALAVALALPEDMQREATDAADAAIAAIRINSCMIL